MSRKVCTLPFVVALFLLAAATVDAGQWARFRGPNGDGVATGQDIPVKFGLGAVKTGSHFSACVSGPATGWRMNGQL